MQQPHVVIFDGSNLFHRARSGFTLGENPVVFNFFRSFRALIEQLKPTRAVVACDGVPKARLALFSEYKANRVIKESEREAHEKFVRQRGVITDLLSAHFPVSVMRHPDQEADDLIYTVVKNASRAAMFTVVSTDTDFIQMLNEFDNVELYNPVTKKYVDPVEYDYITWKALKGDGSDNIPGLPGVGEATAEALVRDPGELSLSFKSGKLDFDLFHRNIELIKLKCFDEKEWAQCSSSMPTRDWDAVKAEFTSYDFKSMVKDTYWSRFVATFDTLWQT